MTTLPVKYPQPQILLIDFDDTVTSALSDIGYNVTRGSFGKVYDVFRSMRDAPVSVNHYLPENIAEYEIVLIDLTVPTHGNYGREIEQINGEGIGLIMGGRFQETFDPRPLAMQHHQKEFNRILQGGGIFVVFAQPRHTETMQAVQFWATNQWDKIDVAVSTFDSWGFLDILSNCEVSPRVGNHINVTDDLRNPISGLLKEFAPMSQFMCTLACGTSGWESLATDKHGDSVGVCFTPQDDSGGMIVLLPQIADKGKFIAQLVHEALPQQHPKLFPHLESRKWIHQPAYELPSVIDLQEKIVETQREAEQRVADLTSQIEAQRGESAYLYDLLTTQADELVHAVEQALSVLGFKHIINVDKQQSEGGKTSRDEDLRIEDRQPLILVEIKGIAGMPSDEDVLQVNKYIAGRMKELKTVNIRGLTIINHQKNLPPLDRQNPFRQLHIDNAQEQELGLMTTWTLYRLVRGFLENKWSSEAVQELFYRDGVIEPIPVHYEPLGKVERIWPETGAIGIVPNQPIQLGDKIGFVLEVRYHEESIASMQINGEEVETAGAGQEVGIRIELNKAEIRKGSMVYKVTT